MKHIGAGAGARIRKLRTSYPCCNGPSIIMALEDVPKETYDRTCPHCSTKYHVERSTIVKPTMMIDILNWLDKNTREYTHKYG